MASRFLLFFFFLCFFFNSRSASVSYQNGLIYPQNISAFSGVLSALYVPEKGFNIYNEKGKLTGKLSRKPDFRKMDQEMYHVYYYKTGSKEGIEFNRELLMEEVDYEVWTLKYFQRKNGFVRIGDTTTNYWLSEKELKAAKFHVWNWKEFLIEKNGKVMGYYAREPGLNLRKEATANSELIIKLDSELYYISLTGQSKGSWVKVKVQVYNSHPCEGEEKVLKTMEGWVKLLDDSGLPNVYFFTRGC